ncbi:MAG: polysaccharide deacetylase family protein [Pseudolabrys sp.]
MGVSRTIAVNARLMPLVGRHDYGVSLPLANREVVLTFDDGPHPPHTNRVLKTLADECLRATFFIVGHKARANPYVLRKVKAAGHTVGTHTQNHPLWRMRGPRIKAEIDGGIAAVRAALGSSGAVAPFFRFPGLFRTIEAERYLRARGLMAWSIDVDSYDWKGIGSDALVRHTVGQLERRGGGILLMHDVNPTMARALPRLIAELKRRGFRIVHVVPSTRRNDVVADHASARPLKKLAAARPAVSRPIRIARNNIRKRKSGSFAEIFQASAR